MSLFKNSIIKNRLSSMLLACALFPIGVLSGSVQASVAGEIETGPQLYKDHCAECHGETRTGAMGPALFPENLSRLRSSNAKDIIKNGLPATQMPAYADKLNDSQVDLITDYIYSKPKVKPTWEMADILASRIIHFAIKDLPTTAQFKADLMNLFIVVEIGDHSATLLNGDTFEPIHRFKTRYALHGGPKYSPDGRFVYFASRDGWVSKFDIYNLKTVSEIRVAINTRNLAVSADGNYLLVGNYLPNSLVILDAKDLMPVKYIPVAGKDGTQSRVSAVYTAPPRNSFVVALKDVKEVWEIPYNKEGIKVYAGWVHDYRKDSGEGDKLQGQKFPVRRIQTKDFLDDFFFDSDYINLIGTARNSHNGQVINMDVGRAVHEVELKGMPHLGSGIEWDYNGKRVMATPNLKEGKVSIIDMTTWKVIKDIKTGGPGFFMRSHDGSPYAWVDVFFGPNNEMVHVIDKSTLEIVKTLKPSPGKNAAHVEFTKDGKFVLLSVWDMDGELIVYDSHTLKEVKRLPMKKPSGKYNVFNKTRYVTGTSH